MDRDSDNGDLEGEKSADPIFEKKEALKENISTNFENQQILNNNFNSGRGKNGNSKIARSSEKIGNLDMIGTDIPLLPDASAQNREFGSSGSGQEDKMKLRDFVKEPLTIYVGITFDPTAGSDEKDSGVLKGGVMPYKDYAQQTKVKTQVPAAPTKKTDLKKNLKNISSQNTTQSGSQNQSLNQQHNLTGSSDIIEPTSTSVINNVNYLNLHLSEKVANEKSGANHQTTTTNPTSNTRKNIESIIKTPSAENPSVNKKDHNAYINSITNHITHSEKNIHHQAQSNPNNKKFSPHVSIQPLSKEPSPNSTTEKKDLIPGSSNTGPKAPSPLQITEKSSTNLNGLTQGKDIIVDEEIPYKENSRPRGGQKKPTNPRTFGNYPTPSYPNGNSNKDKDKGSLGSGDGYNQERRNRNSNSIAGAKDTGGGGSGGSSTGGGVSNNTSSNGVNVQSKDDSKKDSNKADGKTPDGSFCMKQGKSKDKIHNKRTYLYGDDNLGRDTVVSSSYMRILKTLERSKNDSKESNSDPIGGNGKKKDSQKPNPAGGGKKYSRDGKPGPSNK